MSLKFAVSMLPINGRPPADLSSYGRLPPRGSAKDLSKLVGVKQPDHGLVVDTKRAFEATNILKVLFNQRYAEFAPHAFVERLAVAHRLATLGFSIKLLYYKELTPAELLGGRLAHPNIQSVPLYLKKLPPPGSAVNAIHPNRSWARDHWTNFGSKRIKFFSDSAETKLNDVGEGGHFVHIPEQRASIANNSLRSHPDIQLLQQQGHRFYFVMDGEEYHSLASEWFGRNVYQLTPHSDPFVGITEGIMLTDYRYWRQNRAELKRVENDFKLERLHIPEEEIKFLPANFLRLGPRRVMVNSEALQTIELLRSKGIEVEPTPVPLTANRFFLGGLHCMVNEL